MQLKKIVPLALAAVMTTTAAAGAANLPQEVSILMCMNPGSGSICWKSISR